jgi:hypothetical protein
LNSLYLIRISYPDTSHPLAVLVGLLLERLEVSLEGFFLSLLEGLGLLFLQFPKALLHFLLLLAEVLLPHLQVVFAVDLRMMKLLRALQLDHFEVLLLVLQGLQVLLGDFLLLFLLLLDDLLAFEHLLVLVLLHLFLHFLQVELLGQLLVQLELDVDGLLQGDVCEGCLELGRQREGPGWQGRHPEGLGPAGRVQGRL